MLPQQKLFRLSHTLINVFVCVSLLSCAHTPRITTEQDRITLAAYNDAIKLEDYTRAFELISPLAEDGQVDAQYLLAKMYLKGNGIAKDLKKSAKWLQQAAEQDHSQSQFVLGSFYQFGRGVEQDIDLAEKWYLKSDANRNIRAPHYLGRLYLDAQHGKQDISKGLQYHKKSANYGLPDAQYDLASFYYNGTHVEQDHTKAFELFMDAANDGHAFGQFSIGLMLQLGQGTDKNPEQAHKWYTKSAEQGHVTAQYNLALLYYNGEGVPQNYHQAIKWFQNAAEQGNSDAQNYLGVMLDKGHGFAQDDTLAVEWYQKAASQNNDIAQYNLAWMYQDGRGVAKNIPEAIKLFTQSAEQGYGLAAYDLYALYVMDGANKDSKVKADFWLKKAAVLGELRAQEQLALSYLVGDVKGNHIDLTQAHHWFLKAANQGSPLALFTLGDMYYKGEGVAQDRNEAFTWYTKAAEQGDGKAQFTVGRMYYQGDGVERDLLQAKYWLEKSAQQGYQEAKPFLANHAIKTKFIIEHVKTKVQRKCVRSQNPEVIKLMTRSMPENEKKSFLLMMESTKEAECGCFTDKLNKLEESTLLNIEQHEDPQNELNNLLKPMIFSCMGNAFKKNYLTICEASMPDNPGEKDKNTAICQCINNELNKKSDLDIANLFEKIYSNFKTKSTKPSAPDLKQDELTLLGNKCEKQVGITFNQ